MCPGDVVVLYGSLPIDSTRNYSVTVGGQPGFVNPSAANVLSSTFDLLKIAVPNDASLGPSTIVLTHAGAASNAFPVTLTAADPALPLDPYRAFQHGSTNEFVTPSAPAAPGESITVFATGLGATNPPLATGTLATRFAPTVAPVTITVGGKTIAPDFAGHYPLNSVFISFEQDYQVTFTLPADLTPGPQPVTLTIAGATSNTQIIMVGTQTLTGQPTISRITNGANFSLGRMSAGSFVSIFGAGFGAQDNLSAFPATNVNGVSVLFNGVPAPIFALIASAGQINAVVPAELPANGNATVVVQNLNGPSHAELIVTAATAPGIFIVPDPGNSARRNAAALIANTAWLIMPASQARAYGLPACAGLASTAVCGQAAHPGDFVQLYATGLGKATHDGDPNGATLVSGQPAPANGSLYVTTATPTITVAGQLVKQVLYSGLAPGFSGLYQVNFQIPTGITANDNALVQIAMPGGATDFAVIAISP